MEVLPSGLAVGVHEAGHDVAEVVDLLAGVVVAEGCFSFVPSRWCSPAVFSLSMMSGLRSPRVKTLIRLVAVGGW